MLRHGNPHMVFRPLKTSAGIGKSSDLSDVARHIGIVTPPTAGHINPLMALGHALTTIGHRVTLVHMADAAPLIPKSAVGFEALRHPADSPGRLAAHFQTLAQPSGFVGLPRMIRSTAGMTELLLDALPSALERLQVDAVIADSVEPAGALVARHMGLPFVTAVTGLPLIREPNVPPPFLGWGYRPDAIGRNRNAGGYAVSDVLMRPIVRVVNRYARQWGLDPDPRYQWSERLQIAQCPEGLDFPRIELPGCFRYGASWRLPEPEDDLDAGDDRPLIFCSLGSLQGGRKALFAAMTEACAAVGARALVAHGGGLNEKEAMSLPGNPLVRAYWPQRKILPHCAAAILHGGFNTVLDALEAGIPIVAVPLGFEQPATAARLAHIGAARVVTPPAIRKGALIHALRAVLVQSSYRRASARIKAEMAPFDGATQAAAHVDAILRSSRVLRPTQAPPPRWGEVSAG
jgi:zeaxanthin glucosyltransferase